MQTSSYRHGSQKLNFMCKGNTPHMNQLHYTFQILCPNFCIGLRTQRIVKQYSFSKHYRFCKNNCFYYFPIIFSPANDCIKIFYFIWYLFLYLCQTKSRTYEKYLPAFYKHFSFPYCFRASVDRSYGTSFLVDRHEKQHPSTDGSWERYWQNQSCN